MRDGHLTIEACSRYVLRKSHNVSTGTEPSPGPHMWSHASAFRIHEGPRGGNLQRRAADLSAAIRKLVEQLLGIDKVAGIKAFSEPGVDGVEKASALFVPAAVHVEAREACCGSQLR